MERIATIEDMRPRIVGRASDKEAEALAALPLYQNAFKLLSDEWQSFATLNPRLAKQYPQFMGHTLHVFESLAYVGLAEIGIAPARIRTVVDTLTDKPKACRIGARFWIRKVSNE